MIRLAARPTGFAIDSPGDGVPGDGDPEPTIAFPNQLQSIVIRGDRAYLPNIAASPESPLQFQNSTEAFVNVINGVGAGGSDGAALNLHLGARDPEPGKKKLFFANQWAIAFATQTGPGAAYTVAAGSDLLVKLNVDAVGGLSFTVDGDTTRYIDLNDPEEPATSGENAGKNPRGIVITADGAFAYVVNFVSGNISKVDLLRDKVVATIRTLPLPPAGSFAETIAVGAEMFFSSRGHFDRPAHARGVPSTQNASSATPTQGPVCRGRQPDASPPLHPAGTWPAQFSASWPYARVACHCFLICDRPAQPLAAHSEGGRRRLKQLKQVLQYD